MQMPEMMARPMLRRGVLAQITVVGRRSGQPRTAIVNKKPAPRGGFYVAAGAADHQRARNLQAAGRRQLRVKGDEAEYVATELSGDDRDRAIRALAPPFARGDGGITGPAFHLERAA